MNRSLQILLAVSAGFILGAGCDRDAARQFPKSTSATDSSPAASRPQSQRDAAGREQFDGFSFELPKGWTRVTPDREKTKAMLLLDGKRWNTAKGMVKVDAGRPAIPDAKAMAAALAKDYGGAVQRDLTIVDGEQAFQVQASPQRPGLLPKKAIVVFRGERVYLIMAGSVEGIDVTDALEHIRVTWKWEE